MRNLLRSHLPVVVLVLTLVCLNLPVAAYSLDQTTLNQLHLFRPILKSDTVVVGQTDFVKRKYVDREKLLQDVFLLLAAPQTLFSGHDFENKKSPSLSSKEATLAPIFVLTPMRGGFDTPIVMPRERNLIFLQEAKINEADMESLIKRYEIDRHTTIYEPCEGWQSSVRLDFSKGRAAKLLRERYSITEEAEYIKVVEDLTAWRALETPKGDSNDPAKTSSTTQNNVRAQIDYLVNLFDKHTDSKLYTENIPHLISALLLRDQLGLTNQEEYFRLIGELGRPYPSQTKTRQIAALKNLLNDNREAKIYQDNIPLMLAALAVKA